ncbi:polymer-forming cytoskeletal protein [Clostridiaceae bacterium M8S5]|nr:polymer-forming cytoskeletal protein [Clostridiaceae bacterium M8S5]
MFGSKNNSGSSNPNHIDTLIGKDSVIEGKIVTNGTLRIDGTINGDLSVKGNIIIGEAGKIKGNLECHNIEISGTVDGNIKCAELLRITDTGKLFGDIDVKSFIVDEDAVFEGNCKMNKNNVSSFNRDEEEATD